VEGGWLAVVLAVVTLAAEIVRRVWKARDEKEKAREKAERDRDDAWDRGDPGGLF
jgi:heme exporter protein D